MNYEEIMKIVGEMGKANFEELNIEFPDGVKISMKKNNNTIVENSINAVPVTSSNIVIQSVNTNETKKEEGKSNIKTVSSPMVGTFYGSPSPTEKSFVNVGDKVKKGQVLCIIEAMKLMNEIESEYDGEIVEVCVQNEGVVEYGMPLFKIRSSN